MRLSPVEQKVQAIIAPIADEMGLRVLWTEYKHETLTIFAENTKTGTITLDECTQLSREISPILEVEDPINAAYRLNISSPGIDRPLFTAEDFIRFTGLEAKIELSEPLGDNIEGQRKFRGIIESADSQIIKLKTDQGMLDLPLANLYKAKLVMSDALIKATQKLKEQNSPLQSVKEEIE